MSIENKLTYLDGTKDAIKQAIIDKGVSVTEEDTFRSYATKIGEIQGGSGGDCPKYTLDLSDGVKNVFKVIEEIHKIVLPTNMSNVVSMNFCFSKCESLTSITLPDLPNVENMSSCFYSCESLTSITLPELPNVTNMYQCFYSCESLTSITLPELPKVTSMGGCFSFCNSLTSITFPSSLPLLEAIYGCFSYCNSLTSITLPELPNATNFNNIFAYDKNLKSVGLPNLPKIEQIGGGFFNCTSLQNLTIGNINPNITTLTNWAISTCTLLTVDSLVNIMNALPTISDTRTCTIGTTNISKLSPEQLAIATDKGWSIN